MSRINPSVMEELRRQAHDTLIDIRENIRDNRHWMVFPFNVYSSYIPDTETGLKPNNANPSDYGSFIHEYLIIWKVLLHNDKIV